MNFLAHLWLADTAQADLAGAVLGDVWRGADLSALPPALQWSVRLHRAIDAATDRHPVIAAQRAAFPRGRRRYAGIVLDVVCDHLLARQWTRFSAEPLPQFALRAGVAVADAAAWFDHAGRPPPPPARFGDLLQSYAEPAGMELAFRRLSARLRQPAPFLAAAGDWPRHANALQPHLPMLLADLTRVRPREP